MIGGIHHAGMTVSSLDRALSLYRDVLGLEVVFLFERKDASISQIVGFEDAHLKIAFVGVPGESSRLELIEYVHPSGTPDHFESCDPGTGHVCFRVSDIHAMHRQLVEAGVECRSGEPVEIMDGPNRGTLAAYYRDFDGHVFELLQPPPGR